MMKILNSHITTLVILCAFILLCFYCWHNRPDEYVTYPTLSKGQQQGYTKAERRGMDNFFVFEIPQSAIITEYSRDKSNVVKLFGIDGEEK